MMFLLRRKRLVALLLALPSIGTMCLLVYIVHSPGLPDSTHKSMVKVDGGSQDMNNGLLVQGKLHERQPKSHNEEKIVPQANSEAKDSKSPTSSHKFLYKLNKPDETVLGVQPAQQHKAKEPNWNDDIPEEYRVNRNYDGYDEDGEDEDDYKKEVNGDKNGSDFYHDGAKDRDGHVLIEEDDEDEDDDQEDEYDYAGANPPFQLGDFDPVNNTMNQSHNSLIPSRDLPNVKGDTLKKFSKMKDDSVSPQQQTGVKPNLNGDVSNAKAISRQLKNTATVSKSKNLLNSQQRTSKAFGANLRWSQLHHPQYSSSHSPSTLLSVPHRDNAHLPREPATQIQMPLLWKSHAEEVRNYAGIPVVVDRIYWSPQVEELVPKGMSTTEADKYLQHIRGEHAKEILPPSWDRCGHHKNKYIVLGDGSTMCARYRDPHLKLVYGELFTFHLSRYLGLDNVPAVVLSWANSTDPMWQNHQLSEAGWSEGKVLALIQWINGLSSPRSRVQLPTVIQELYKNASALTRHSGELQQLPLYELTSLFQWSDLILFDYITGHYDRVASMQDSSIKEGKYTSMGEKIRNLQRDIKSDKLWLIDNESGLFDAYELLYMGKAIGQNFIYYHKRMLQTICIFHRSVVDRLRHLASKPFPDEELYEFVSAREPILAQIVKPPQYYLYVQYFKERILQVLHWIESCKTR